MNITQFKEKFSLMSFVRENFDLIDNGSYLLIKCPFHYEETPSCKVDDDGYRCYGASCGAHGDSIDFLMNHLGLSFSEVLNGHFPEKELYAKKDEPTKRPTIVVPLPNIAKAHRALLCNSRIKQYIKQRHISEGAAKQLMLGYNLSIGRIFFNFDGPRIVIPVFSITGELVNCRYRIDPGVALDGPKYLGHPGRPPSLFNAQFIMMSDAIVIAGSELDAAALHGYGINAVAPPGEGVFLDLWADYLWGKRVLVWYDYDAPGAKASLMAYKKLKLRAKKVELFEWPSNFNDKDDIKNFIDMFGPKKTKEVVNAYLGD